MNPAPAPAPASYWTATRHPWSCVLFVLPLLLLYEFGLYWLGPAAPEAARNGADVWLRRALTAAGVSTIYGAPCVLVAVLLAWSFWRRQDRPADQVGVWVGMTVESALFALALFGASQALIHATAALEQRLGPGSLRMLSWSAAQTLEPAFEPIIRSMGAGIYEETLFRLLTYSALLALCTMAEFPPRPGVAIAALGSALLFATAHHLGPGGDAWNSYVFAFRSLAGLYFAGIFQARGFGIAVGAHAGYDVLVTLIVR